ncbi:S8 family serine peptidase [Streptomyces edwardsiae]|uniref:S8 family serine peptidase n=1 Tax=Streptomyces edwardsiae TaxID=3075527 RepID=A0ABU2PX93_9ACTN|nr:S8 family serine peptidase [Streptomyces sp. DSM 41636]MDT0395885.1 S8 family serine peptidase [Streptomyces sp. DSM 41636]
MTHSPQREPIPGARRVARIAVAAGLVAALSAAGPIPLAMAADNPPAAPADADVKSAHDKLGADDADLLAEAKAAGDKNVTLMIATAPGKTEQVAAQLDAVKGGSVGRTHDRLGYVRATVPTGKADAAIAAAAKLSSVHGVDLREEIPLDDPTPSADTARKAGGSKGTAAYPAPDRRTPADNPYNPSFETGAVDFVEDNPKADGRGVTIGILDSGVDLGHPALQKTTTGERKIVDWVTATDPIVDSDQTWRPMVSSVSGPAFTYGGRTWRAPAGSYRISTFLESYTTGGDAKGDANRDGDTTDSWGVLYDAASGTVRVDLNNNQDFGDDTPMKPYKDGFQIGYFGTDDPKTDIAERQPFVVEIREDVPMDPYGGDWVGKTADFVNIGVIESEHGTHVAGITAANGLFGGRMDGAAPGANIVSSRACTWSGGCTNVALTEGMIDLVTERGVDIVNMSIGGLPALNDGNNARAELYTRLIDTYGVQLVISAGNSGPGANTIGDPGLADKVISVGASVSRETWAANYGSVVKTKYAMMPFSSRGPREDGGFTPTLVAPGAAINTIQTWMPGAPVAEAGYGLPAGYGMLQGTSMASPQATGATALLLSAAKRKHIELTPADLRTALTSTAEHIKGVQAYEEGAGLIDIEDAWDAIRDGATAHDYTVKAPVDTAIDQFLATPGFGTGLYDREGGLKAGQKKTYDVTITRTSGPDRPVRHELGLENNADHTFRIVGDDDVRLPLNQPVTVKVQAAPRSAGLKSAILEVDDPRTEGVDQQILSTVVVSAPLRHTFSARGTAQRNDTTSYFVTVPEGARTLEIAMSGLKDESQTRFIAIHPYGVPADSTSTPDCYNNYNDGNGCRPDVRSYADPQPGVWEIEVEARRTSPLLDNPYKLDVAVLGAAFDPETVTVPEAKIGTPAAVSWTVTNEFAALDGKLVGGPLGSSKTTRPAIATGDTHTTTVEVPAGATSLDVAIGNVTDASADLDLTVYDADGVQVAQSADGDSEESVSLASPAAGTYTVEVAGYSVPAGSTDYDYLDVFFSASLGSVGVDDSTPVKLGTGDTATVSGDVTVAAAAPEGRAFFGRVQLVNARGTVAGLGNVAIEKVVP